VFVFDRLSHFVCTADTVPGFGPDGWGITVGAIPGHSFISSAN